MSGTPPAEPEGTDPGVVPSSPVLEFSSRTAFVGLCAFVLTLTLYANASLLVTDRDTLRFFPPYIAGYDANANRHLGAEYMNIARALAAGRGFADPFFVESGPTAWMPPLYPALLTGLLIATGSETGVVCAVLFAKGGVLVATGMLIFWAARRFARRLRPEFALVAYALWITAHFDWFFQITHDIWLLMGLVDILLIGAWRLLEAPELRRAFLGWGALGGVTALASPVLGAAWGAATLFLAQRRRAWALAAAACAIAAALVFPWVLRNHAVFGEWILVKSNLAYDLYQANYVSQSGVYDEPFLLRHPVWTTMRAPNSVYRTQGEGAFLARYRVLLVEAFEKDPAAVVRGAATRALAATLVYTPYRPRVEGEHPPWRTLLHPFAFLGLVLLVALRRSRLEPQLGVVVILYGVVLAPYVLAAFYLRYLLPLTPVLMLLAFAGADALAANRDAPARS